MIGFRSAISLLCVVALGAAVTINAGCSKKPKPSTDVTETIPPPPPPEEELSGQQDAPPVEQPVVRELQDVFFDYDKYNLRDDARSTLDNDAKALLEDTAIRVLLEGHCDERGTVEYNLALGERRAQSVRNYLVEFGVEAGRVSTISYGEERPFAEGHSEEAWSQNRRVHFVKQ